MELNHPLQPDNFRLPTNQQVAEFLQARFPDGVSELALAGQGEWSRAYAFRQRGHDYIICFAANKDDFEKDRRATSFASPALPLPAVMEIGRAFHDYYTISERIVGKPCCPRSSAPSMPLVRLTSSGRRGMGRGEQMEMHR